MAESTAEEVKAAEEEKQKNIEALETLIADKVSQEVSARHRFQILFR